MDNMDKKVKIQLEKELVNKLIKMKKVGESYSDVLRKLINFYEKYGEKNDT